MELLARAPMCACHPSAPAKGRGRRDGAGAYPIRSGIVCLHRSHFGSRYKTGCCGHAGLLIFGPGSSPGGCWRSHWVGAKGAFGAPAHPAPQADVRRTFTTGAELRASGHASADGPLRSRRPLDCWARFAPGRSLAQPLGGSKGAPLSAPAHPAPMADIRRTFATGAELRAPWSCLRWRPVGAGRADNTLYNTDMSIARCSDGVGQKGRQTKPVQATRGPRA
jgi:hypothetical protein